MSDAQTGFSFSVTFEGDTKAVQFREVSGLEASFDTEEVVEGGENRFVHRLPKPAKTTHITLKRAVSDHNHALVAWCKDTLERDLSKAIHPKQVVIALHDVNDKPVASWTLTHAYPVKWRMGGFDAMKTMLAVEEIELAYSSMTRDT